MCTQDINIDKYGFSLKIEKEGHFVYTYERDGKEVELSVRDNFYTINLISNDTIIKVANRYRVETQEQLDFLILNGRVGVLFVPLSCHNHAV